MRQLYLILAAMLLLCLAPMPYGYSLFVRFVAIVRTLLLLPQRFILPSIGESHGGRIDNGILGEQRLDVICECALGIDGTEPIGNINNKPPLFQSLNLLSEGKGLLGIVHVEKTKSRPVALPRERTCAGIYWMQRYEY